MSEYRKDIDGLRAVAVIPVVLHHAGVPAISGGFVGVDVFFVISGFLITGIIRGELKGNAFSLLGFYERRARRILPALFFMMAACFAVGLVILLPSELVELAKSAAATTVFLSNVWFWRTSAAGGYFGEASEFMPLLHTWSLAVEEQFYLLFPLVLALLWKRVRQSTWLVILGGTLASFALAAVAAERWATAAFYLTPTRAWELGLGALIALSPQLNLSARWLRELVAAAGVTAILVAVFTYTERTPLPGIPALLPCLGAAALLIAGGAGKSLTSTLLSWGPIAFIGLISYSLYLWHWPILAFLRIHYGVIDLSPALAVAGVAGAVIVAALSWAFVERPFRRRTFLRRRSIFMLSGAAMAAALGLAAMVYFGAGFPQRIAPEALALADAANDENPRRFECFGVPPPRELCQIGADTEGPVDFLFWGDSQADALMPGMDLAARNAGRSGIFVGSPGCPPVVGVESDDYPGCRSFNHEVMAMLERREDLQLVVLYARWASYRAVGGDDAVVEMRRASFPSQAQSASVLERHLRQTVEAIIESGRHIVIIGGTPEFRWAVPRRVYLQSRFGGPPPPILDAEDVRLQNASLEALFASLAEGPRVTVVSPLPVLCDGECMILFEGRPVYRDNFHLSAFAAQEVMSPFLEQVLSRQPRQGIYLDNVRHSGNEGAMAPK